MVRQAAAVVGGGAAAMLGGTAAAAQAPGVASGQARRTFRAYVALGREASMQTLTLLPIGPRQVVVRTEAAQICYSTTRQGLGAVNVAQAVIPCHGGVGTVIEVGASVERVTVGQRVIVAGQAQCGTCYNCLRGRADHCLRGNADGNPNGAIAEMRDGTKVAGFRAGCSELMVAFEHYCVPVVTT
ncbi:MAG TPA: alcohol dehydrogenase catalytic domain-containing protein, partial [Vicinamibacterales bacterium]